MVQQPHAVVDAPKRLVVPQYHKCTSKHPMGMGKLWKSLCGSDHHSYGPRRNVIYMRSSDDGYPRGTSRGRVATVVNQTCSACGKFRSPGWSARHPLRFGESPRANLCKRCADKSTSSEEASYRKRKKKHCQHHHHHHGYHHGHHHRDDYRTSSSLDSFTSDEHKRYCRRCRSNSLAYVKPRHMRKPHSSEGVNIIIQNQAGKPESRVHTISSSSESIRITTRITSERASPRHASSFEDEIVREHYLPRRRSLSRARYVKV